ncbi:hypothetical protein SH449x_003070 [Pirellulaceae bacterium SH449]
MAFLSQSVVQAILGILILLIVLIVAYYMLLKLRGSSIENIETLDLLKKNFEEMRSEGDISEAEYRRISASLKGGVNSNTLVGDSTTEPKTVRE